MTTRRASSLRAGTFAVDEFLRTLDHPHKEGIELLRGVILEVDPRVMEEIKWNAPSFMLESHFATFKLYPPTGIRLVLHVGSRSIVPSRQFSLEVSAGLVKWAAPDRCVLTVSSFAEASRLQGVVEGAVRQWIAQL